MVKFAGIKPLTKPLRSQSIWYSLVVGSTSATSLRLVIIGSRVIDAITRSCEANGVMPGPEICRSSFTSGCSLIRVPVSWMPMTWASASTPVCSSACGLGRRLGAEARDRQRNQHVGRGDQQSGPEHPLHDRLRPGGEVDGQEDGPDDPAQQDESLDADVPPEQWPSAILLSFAALRVSD